MSDISDKLISKTSIIKYPRFFILSKGKWAYLLFLRIDQINGPVYRIHINGEKSLSNWTEGNCEFNVLNGLWKEIDKSEAALII